ncbi:MAG: ATP-binding protein [Candidatus Competibacteraceae bacterium]|nr:ATP-binding protein [Candidatus Competibacteraceae bacterium]
MGRADEDNREGRGRRWLSNLKFVVPFGAYLGDRRRDDEDEGILVGRLKQRARLLGALLNDTHRGAILVTGHRGSGKTTLVNHCIDEYESAVYERYLNRNVGKQFLWDGFALIITMLAGFVFLGAGRQIIELLVSSPEPTGVFTLTVGCVVTLFLLLPWLAASAALRELANLVQGRFPLPACFKRNGIILRFIAMLVLASNCVIVLWVTARMPAAEQSLSAASLIFMLTLISIFANATVSTLPSQIKAPVRWCLVPILVLTLILLVSFCFATELPKNLPASMWIMAGNVLFVYGMARLHKHLRAQQHEYSKPAILASRLAWLGSMVAWPVGLFIAAMAGASLLPHLIFVALGLVVGLILRLSRQNFTTQKEMSRFTCVLLLALKAHFLLAVAIQVLSPLAWVIAKNRESEDLSGPAAAPFSKEKTQLAMRSPRDLTTAIDAKLPDDVFLKALPNSETSMEAFPPLVFAHASDPEPASSPGLLIQERAHDIAGPMVPFQKLLQVATAQPMTHEAARSEPAKSNRIAPISTSSPGALKSAMGNLANELPDLRKDKIHIACRKLIQKIARDFEEGAPSWLLVNLAHLLTLFLWEFEVIVRFANPRRDRSIREEKAERPPDARRALDRYRNRLLLEQSLFYRLFRSWIPVLVVPVNLGLDNLDHRRVIEAMLTGLRDEYHLRFFSPRSVIGFFRLLAVTFLTIMVTLITSHQFFSSDMLLRRVAKDESHLVNAGVLLPVCQEGNSTAAISAPGAQLACWVGREPLGRLLYSPVAPRAIFTPTISERHGRPLGLLGWPLKHLDPIWMPTLPSKERTTKGTSAEGMSAPRQARIYFRFYHLLSLLLSWLGVRMVASRLWPYTQTLKKIDTLLVGLSSKTRQETVNAESVWSRVVGVISGHDRDRFLESDLLDPRTVEVATLTLLAKLQEMRLELPFLTRHHLSWPAPEIIFKFDELDKLGIGVIPEHDSSGPEAAPTPGLDLERRRSEALHNLFSDMKNLIGSGVARFIFIGGRNLHDEWLADLGDRRPLLTHIFVAELHLPSLLTEGPGHELRDIDDANVRWFIFHLWAQCQVAFESAWPMNLSIGLESSRYGKSYCYTQTLPEEVIYEDGNPSVLKTLKGKFFGLAVESDMLDLARQFSEDFVDFLCYRSRGNPRRLRMLVESFLDQRDRVARFELAETEARQLEASEHVLIFREIERFRIQIIAEIYRRFNLAIGGRFSFSDDKLITGALYIADFLLKFHRRAFGWANLQHVDELVHVHRSPDLPEVLTQVLSSWLGRYLHGIRNGMYDYRFSGEFSQELRYLSRRSEEEMAALNFTLDESQELKAVYLKRFQQLKDENSWEFVVVLGELHEFDEEYELARFYYQKAISYLDARLERKMKAGGKHSALFEVLTQTSDGLEIVRRRISWALARLRVNLQIGMSYERSEDYEQAEVHYRSSRTFAASVIRALLNAYRERQAPNLLLLPRPADRGRPDFQSTLKHLNLLFQATFAEAWVEEKLRGGVDTSLRCVERSLWELRWILPGVSEEFDALNPTLKYGGVRNIRVQHMNFFLTMADLHNKAGDLYFYKACPIAEPRPNDIKSKTFAEFGGFVGGAQYHYGLAIQEIRSFVSCRRERWQMPRFDDEPGEESASEGTPWTEFVYEATAEFLADLGDSLVARVSLRDVLAGTSCCAGWAGLSRQRFERNLRGCWQNLKGWMEELPGIEPEVQGWSSGINDIFPGLEATAELDAFFGRRCPAAVGQSERMVIEGFRDLTRRLAAEEEYVPRDVDKIGKKEEEKQTRFRNLAQDDVQSLLHAESNISGCEAVANYFQMLSLSSVLLEEGGRPEDAARKASRVVEAAASYIMMARCVGAIRKIVPATFGSVEDDWARWHKHFAMEQASCVFVEQIVAFGVRAAERASALYRRARYGFEQADAERFSVGNVYPAYFGIHVCSLYLGCIALFGLEASVTMSAFVLLEELIGKMDDSLCESREGKIGTPAEQSEDGFAVRILRVILERNTYPVLGRLCGLKALLDHELLCRLEGRGVGLERDEGGGELLERMEELLATEALFDGPLHFTPFSSGITQALCAIAAAEGLIGEAVPSVKARNLRRALAAIDVSLGMITMKKEFYRAIDKLYYLYDDFNDRRIHFNHAMQMAGVELSRYVASVLEAMISRSDRGTI